MKLLPKILFSLSLLTFVNTSPAFSDPLSMSSKFYSEQGIAFYKKGDQASAAREFNKALQSDPSNAEAQKYLNEMGIVSEIYTQPLTNTVKIAKLSQEMKVYQDKMGDLEAVNAEVAGENELLYSEKEKLCEIVQEKEDEVDTLSVHVNLLKGELSQSTQVQEQKIQTYKKLNDVNESEIEFLERMVNQHKELVGERDDILSEQEAELTEKNDQLAFVRDLSKQEIAKTEDERIKERNEYKQTINQLNHNLKQKEMELAFAPKGGGLATDTQGAISSTTSDLQEKVQLLKKKDNDIALLKERLVAARRQISDLEKRTQGAAEIKQVAELKSQVEKIQDELSKKNLSLSAQESDLQLLQERLQDAQEQLGLVQSVVEEKETQIQALEAEVKQIRQKCQ